MENSQNKSCAKISEFTVPLPGLDELKILFQSRKNKIICSTCLPMLNERLRFNQNHPQAIILQ